MYSIDYSPQAKRTLHTLPLKARRLIVQLLNGVAEMAELFRDEPDVWARLGRVEDGRVEVEVERRGLWLQVDSAAAVVRVLRIIEPRRPAQVRTRVRRVKLRPAAPALHESRA